MALSHQYVILPRTLRDSGLVLRLLHFSSSLNQMVLPQINSLDCVEEIPTVQLYKSPKKASSVYRSLVNQKRIQLPSCNATMFIICLP